MASQIANFALEGKTAIVTGGSAGIGLAIVRLFVEAGANVLAAARRDDGADILEIEAPGAVYFQADLSDPEAPDSIVAAAVEAFGSVDILVNNAALFDNRQVADYTAQYIDAMSAVNIRSVLLLIRAFAAHLESRQAGGTIVNISSVEGMRTTMPAGMGAYSATKAAVRGLTVSLAHEFAPAGIRVNAIAPGAVVHDNMFALAAAEGYPREAVEQGLEAVRVRTHSGRLGRPEDIANACLFLASPASDYISGQTIVVDGGISVTGC